MTAAPSSSSRSHFASSSLYVGDLAPEVSETTLYEFFNSIGPVASIRVCRDSGSRRSLGYAYVNYHSTADAERALEALNYTNIKGHPCRIMFSQRDPTVRRSNMGNLFVKNLDTGVDNRALHDTFSLFGDILSCKVVCDEVTGKSRGYGFVHFESDEAAAAAVERVNGMKIGTKEVFVGPFYKRTERPSGRAENFTNLYCNTFPKTWDEEKLKQIFSQFGEVTSIWLSQDKHSRPFACVNLADTTAAKEAVAGLNGKKVNAEGLLKEEEQETAATEADKAVDSEPEVYTLFVDRAQDKTERGSTIRARMDNSRQSQASRAKYEGVNLYIKNLPDHVDDEGLRSMFDFGGTITSAKVMRDEEGHSKGFGFVCFSNPDEATKAMADMHLKNYEGKPLYVGLAEQKDRRHARLQNHFRSSTRNAAPQQPQQAPNAFPGPVPFYMGAAGQPTQPMMWQPGLPGAGYAPQAVWKTPYHVGGMPNMMGGPQARQAPRVAPPMSKQLLGEQLFPLVSQHQPELAGKITGMMLDMDNLELERLIKSESDLKAKIAEALLVLEQANKQ